MLLGRPSLKGKADEFCDVAQKRREREIQQQMESRDEETLELKETYSSLQQEVDIKTKKLKKVRNREEDVGGRQGGAASSGRAPSSPAARPACSSSPSFRP